MPSTSVSRVLLAFVQIVVVLLLLWIWTETSESDATATSIDWSFIALTAATPAVFGALALAGRKLRRGIAPLQSILLRALVMASQVMVSVLFAVTAFLAPFVILVAVFIEPIG